MLVTGNLYHETALVADTMYTSLARFEVSLARGLARETRPAGERIPLETRHQPTRRVEKGICVSNSGAVLQQLDGRCAEVADMAGALLQLDFRRQSAVRTTSASPL